MQGLYVYTLIIGTHLTICEVCYKNNIAKGIAKTCEKQCVLGKKVNSQQQQNKKSNTKTLAGAGN